MLVRQKYQGGLCQPIFLPASQSMVNPYDAGQLRIPLPPQKLCPGLRVLRL